MQHFLLLQREAQDRKGPQIVKRPSCFRGEQTFSNGILTQMREPRLKRSTPLSHRPLAALSMDAVTKEFDTGNLC